MVTIDLTTPPPLAASFLDGLPRRLTLTLPELRHAAHLAGDAPLPFDLAEPAETSSASLEGRLGQSRGSIEDTAYAAALASLHEADETLRHRGLITDDGVDPGITGAIGLLATPTLALDIDVSAGNSHVKAWHRQAGNAVATLATCDGIVFELAWFATDQWPAELSRAAAIPGDVSLSESSVPEEIDLPFQLVDAVGEALRSGRADLVPVLLSQHGEGIVDGESRPINDTEAGTAVAAIHTEGQGRLRVLAARVSADETTKVGLVSWVLVADGWHSLRPHQAQDASRLRVRRISPADLATELAPILAQVTA
ncbi:hypothetical protein [Nocardioides sp.]|uniref:hypothetical protein n=1 Tax=Nocardioides sp. TaxID=35761 RepID=UPI002C427DA2|nr:hypothetical protein [Nocardioides sp.]HXH80091.1 hypothetical protein [Nocardioides sp.]